MPVELISFFSSESLNSFSTSIQVVVNQFKLWAVPNPQNFLEDLYQQCLKLYPEAGGFAICRKLERRDMRVKSFMDRIHRVQHRILNDVGAQQDYYNQAEAFLAHLQTFRHALDELWEGYAAEEDLLQGLRIRHSKGQLLFQDTDFVIIPSIHSQ